MARHPAEKERIESTSQELIELTGDFCEEHLNEEYAELSRKLIEKMGRNQEVPFLQGLNESWAAGVIYALGQINFLFDERFEPYVQAGAIPEYFGISQSTATQKARTIREMFDLEYYDTEFSTDHAQESNPLNDMAVVDGLLVPLDSLGESRRDSDDSSD